jgi:hypothetical protein
VSYLESYTLGSLIRSALAIYLRNWPPILVIYAIPLVPLHLAKMAITTPGATETVLALLLVGLEGLANMFVTFPATIAVSEICLGVKPSVSRSYRRAFADPGRVIGTYLLAFVIIFLGMLALLVPGIIFALWYMFVGPVVMIESLGGWAALKRSRELGRGYYWRNLGIYFLVTILAILSVAVVGAVLGGVLGIVFFLLGVQQQAIIVLVASLAALAIMPVVIVTIVLLYYDMRARKEGYGAAQLAEDMRF